MPDWTEQDQHDPGITLVELGAWLAAGLGLYVALGRRRKRRQRTSAKDWEAARAALDLTETCTSTGTLQGVDREPAQAILHGHGVVLRGSVA